MIEGGYWEILIRIGTYAAGEQSPEESRETERFIAVNAEVRRLAESYARMLALLSAVGKESPTPPEALVERTMRRSVRRATYEGGGCSR